MADINDVKSISDLLGQVTDGFSHFFTNLEGTLEKLSGIPNLLNGSNDSLKKTTDSAKEASTALDKTHEVSENFLQSIIDIGGATIDTFSAMASGNRDAVANLGNLNEGVMDVVASLSLMSLGVPTAFNELNQSSKDVSSNLNQSLGPAFDNLVDKLSKLTHFPFLDEFKKVADTTFPAIDSVNNLENSLLALHGRSGDLTKTFEQTGASTKDLSKLTDEFNNSIKRTADNTGASIPSIVSFTGEVLKIPGLYDQIIKTNLSENIGYVEAAMKVARGTTQDYGDVIGVVNTQFEDFNQKGQGPLELMSRMYSVSQSLGVPFNYISSQVKTTADQFKFLGDNTQGALNIIEGLSPKLLASGLGPKAVQELIGNVIGSINQLDVAQKSLLSSRTGGAGGLQGGFQIDQLLAEGKVDDVYKKIEDSLKQQFGGKVTTLKEGSQSQAGAAQLQKEVAYLTQGPFGALVKSSGEAYKLLENFKAGQSGAPKEAKTPEQLKEGLNKTLDTGKQIEQLQYTELQKIANGIEALKIFSAQQLGKSGRDIAKVQLEKEQTSEVPFKYSGKNNPNASENLAFIGADVSKSIRDTISNVGSKLSVTEVEKNAARNKNENNINSLAPTKENNSNILAPTPVEINTARPNNNLTPQLKLSPDNDAAQQRQNILRSAPVPGTVLASANNKTDQTLTIKVISTGLDGKTEEKIMAKVDAQIIKKIETAKSDDNSFATVGHK